MNFKKLQQSHGFTLVEMIMAVVVFLVSITVVLYGLRYLQEFSNMTQQKITVQDQMQKALYNISKDLQQSAPGRITINEDSDQITFDIPEVGSVDSNYKVLWVDGSEIQYAIGGTGDQLIRTNNTDSTSTVVANYLTSITFTGNQPQPTLVTVQIQGQKDDGNGRMVPENPLSMEAKVRIQNS